MGTKLNQKKSKQWMPEDLRKRLPAILKGERSMVLEVFCTGSEAARGPSMKTTLWL